MRSKLILAALGFGWMLGLVGLPTVVGQVPSIGGCPVYQAMTGFDRERFMGTWYEVERYFTVTELAARCISATYERHSDNTVWINNSITNRFTGVTRLIAGKMKLIGKSGEAKYNVQFTTLPFNYDSMMMVLDTDYDTFAVIWSCNGIGPIGHTESAWVMTRERLPPGTVLQRAYGVLDKFQISRRFFIETDQKNCDPQPPAFEAYDPTEPTEQKKKKKGTSPSVEKTYDTPIGDDEETADDVPIDGQSGQENISNDVNNIMPINNSTV